MNPHGTTSFESLNEPIVVDGRRRLEARTGPATNRTELHASCVTCGATASDWRHLLGVGASVAARSADSQGMVLTYPGACGRCGASELVVDIRAAEKPTTRA
jgi:hypothetical protein